MQAILTKPECFPISDEERLLIEQHRAAAVDRVPVKLADITSEKVNALSRADQQKLLERLMAGEVE